MNGNYSFLWICANDNIEMIQIFIDYANNKTINLELNEKRSE